MRCGSGGRGATDVPVNPVARFLRLSVRICEAIDGFRQETRMPNDGLPAAKALAGCRPNASRIPENYAEVRRCAAGQFLGRSARELSVAADFSSQLADFELVHLELERAQGNAQGSGGPGHVPGRLLERPDD